ncbi:MAG: 3-oxoacyl-[acyl-carrier-protein] reductase [Bacteroidota bacterium]
MGNLDKKIALVTGGSRGIGKAIAVSLAEAGASVMILDVLPMEEINKTVDELRKLGVSSAAYQADARSFEQAAKTIDEIVKEYQRIDILVNNAGITRDNLLLRMSEEDWNAVLDINLKSVFNFTKAASKHMMSQRSGKIISIASVVGIMGNAGQANYSASKAGIIGFTKSIAKELGSRNIQVNAVAPGFIETPMTAKLNEEQRKKLADTIPLKRIGKPEDVAAAVRFLASPEADYISGQVLCVDGGML